MDKWMEQAAAGARSLVRRFAGHQPTEAQEQLAAAYMCGFIDAKFGNEVGRKTEQSGENARS